jgi:hypothetical protein
MVEATQHGFLGARGFILLGAGQLVWEAAGGQFRWEQYVLMPTLALAYLVTQGVVTQRLSKVQALRMSLVGTVLAMIEVVGFCVYMMARTAQEPKVDDRAAVGFAVLFGGFALLGIGMAVPYILRLLRLIRSSEPDDS